MSLTESQELLRVYVRERSETAFQELVNRYIDLVYAVAIRRTGGDSLLAQDITQLVFTDLAAKAASLSSGTTLGGWLHRHTGFVAATTMRGEHRRRERERTASEMNLLNQAPDPNWEQLAPVLDEAMDELDPADRDALVLRFFERRDLRAVGAALGTNEDAAQKRVSRAVEKLRTILVARQGAAVPAAAVLAAALGGATSKAAPVGLAATVGKTAFAVAGCKLPVAGAAGLGVAGKIWAGAGAVVAATVAVVLMFHSSRPEFPAILEKVADAPTPTAMASPVAVSNQEAVVSEPAPVLPAVTATAAVTDSNALHLLIVAADSGKPVPGVQIDYRGWEKRKYQGRTLQANRFGECDIVIPRSNITQLELTTRSDTFADTRLNWHTDRGDVIPTSATLRLVRPVSIGGTVVDPEGHPVADAKVGFNHEDDPAGKTSSQSHEFGWIQVKTDAEGKWSINRIAPEMIRRIYGSASHPAYVQSGLVFASRDAKTEKALREGTYVFHLGQAVTVRGIVVGPDDVPIAGAEVLVGKRMMSDARKSKTGGDGTFEIGGCRPGKTLLSAEADGFGATTREVELKPDAEPFRLILQAGKLLRVRVVDKAGRPVPKATLYLDTMNNRPINDPDYGKITVQASFDGHTDSDGRLVWSNAPTAEVTFDVTAKGHMRVEMVTVAADGVEHEIVLPPALVVSGTVTDASNGTAIPKFRIVTGFPTKDLEGGVRGEWSTIDRYWANFTGGTFKHVLEEPALYDKVNPGFMLKFEAEGYAPFVSRVIEADEGNVRLDVTMRASTSQSVTVVNPDGSRAAGAEVGLVSRGARLEVKQGGFDRRNSSGTAALLRTDAVGQFNLPGDDAITRIVVVTPSGCAEAVPGQLTANPQIILQPWGRIEGTYLAGGKPAADVDLALQFGQGDFQSIDFSFEQFKVKTDADGRFVFPMVPAGVHKLNRLVPAQPAGFAHMPLEDVEIRPGETTTVTLGGKGYTVTARLRFPEGYATGSTGQIMTMLQTAPPESLLAALRDPQAAAALQDSPEAKEYARTAKHFQMSQSASGVLSAENIPAGKYMLFAMAVGKAGDGGLSGQATFTVPEEPVNGSLDLGEVVLKKAEAGLAGAKGR